MLDRCESWQEQSLTWALLSAATAAISQEPCNLGNPPSAADRAWSILAPHIVTSARPVPGGPVPRRSTPVPPASSMRSALRFVAAVVCLLLAVVGGELRAVRVGHRDADPQDPGQLRTAS